MQRVSFDRANLPQTVAVALVHVVALGVLGFVGAYWTWTWFAPRPAPPAHATEKGSDAPADALFGEVQGDHGAAQIGVAIRLLGVVAATEGRLGYAVMQLDTGEIVAVTEGEEAAPGIRLAEVGIDFAVVERGGSRETLMWPEKGAVTKSPISPGGQ